MPVVDSKPSAEWVRGRLGVLGSVSSINSLAVVVLDKVAVTMNVQPQYASWRIIFFLFSVFGMGGLTIFTYHWAMTALFEEGKSLHRKILSTTFRTLLGIILIGVFLDAFFAAVYWTPWMLGAVRLGKIMLNIADW